jgi:hypothetical protein
MFIIFAVFALGAIAIGVSKSKANDIAAEKAAVQKLEAERQARAAEIKRIETANAIKRARAARNALLAQQARLPASARSQILTRAAIPASASTPPVRMAAWRRHDEDYSKL